jgi:hypothetical protein
MTVRLSNKRKKVQQEQKVIHLQDDRNKYAKRTQHQRKLTRDTQRRRSVFELRGNTLSKNIAVRTDECRTYTAKKDRRKINKPSKKDRYMTSERELNVENL